MGRIFRRGELKEAIVVVLASLGEAHGYAIMTDLKERIGGGWKPSPGAVYPALLALVETGYVEAFDKDDNRVYRLTGEGRRAAGALSPSSRWASLVARSENDPGRTTVGSLLDRYAAESALRRKLAGPEETEKIEAILARASEEIGRALEKGEIDG